MIHYYITAITTVMIKSNKKERKKERVTYTIRIDI
jgi:hypothetical protein